jgi:hypothetical protein
MQTCLRLKRVTPTVEQRKPRQGNPLDVSWRL